MNIAITGASSGIGKELVLNYLQDHHIIAGARRVDRIRELDQPDTARNGSLLPVALDVTKPAAVAAFFDTIETQCGTLDILINNAGIGYTALIEASDMEKLRYMFDVNFFGMVQCTQQALLRVLQPGSTIVNILSEVSYRGFPLLAGYSATKAAAQAFAEGLRLECKPRHIKVINVYPGFVSTEFHAASNEFSSLERPPKEGVSAKSIADHVQRAIAKGTTESIPMKSGYFFKYMSCLCPSVVDWFLYRKFTKERQRHGEAP